ncbi:MAG TPA: hypothetical protein PKE55_11405 [Kiritimatiellia bacterium]|nr:hypothetical protein [Kiritimatiellia bacterium]
MPNLPAKTNPVRSVLDPYDKSQVKDIASQLEAQYRKALAGAYEQLKFGAMILQVRDAIWAAKRKDNLPTRGPGSGGGSLPEWLSENCTSISQATAYRWMQLAEAVKESMQIGVKTDLVAMLEANPGDLPPKYRKLRDKIEAMVDGRSATQIISAYRIGVAEPKARGGAREGAGRKMTTVERETDVARVWWTSLIGELNERVFRRKTYALLTPEEIKQIDATLMDVRSALKEVLK